MMLAALLALVLVALVACAPPPYLCGPARINGTPALFCQPIDPDKEKK